MTTPEPTTAPNAGMTDEMIAENYASKDRCYTPSDKEWHRLKAAALFGLSKGRELERQRCAALLEKHTRYWNFGTIREEMLLGKFNTPSESEGSGG